MIPTHRAKPNTEPISIPAIGPGGAIWLYFSVLPLNTSGCVCLINSTALIVLMVSISSFTGFGVEYGLQNSDSARKVPLRDFTVIRPQLTPIYRQDPSRDILCNDL